MKKGYSMKGTVKMFNKEKGYITDESKKDVFFHYSAIEMSGYKTAHEGDEVEFDEEQSDRGLRANHVHIVKSNHPANSQKAE